MERRSRCIGRPQSFALPACFRIIDAAVHPFGIETHGIRNAQGDEFPFDQCEQRVVHVTRGNGHVFAQTEGVELIDPCVVARLDTASLRHVFELWSGKLMERPSLGAMFSRCSGTVEDFAFATIETSEMPARE